jgi:hypothetical protein
MAWKYPAVKRGMKMAPGKQNWGTKAVGGMANAGKKSLWTYKGTPTMGAGSKAMENAINMGKGKRK